MIANLQNPIFTDEMKAREWLEARVWPNGPVCPHCGATAEDVTKLEGEKHRPGVYQCNQCREQFTVTVKSAFERSHVALSKWLAALFLLTASAKGVSAHQVHRSLGVTYKTAWFMMHRLREAMRQGGLAVRARPSKWTKPNSARSRARPSVCAVSITVSARPCSCSFNVVAQSAASMSTATRLQPSCLSFASTFNARPPPRHKTLGDIVSEYRETLSESALYLFSETSPVASLPRGPKSWMIAAHREVMLIFA